MPARDAALLDWDPNCPSAREQLVRRRSVVPDGGFLPLPAPVGAWPYRRALDDVIGPERAARVMRGGAIAFHVAGDSGGHRDPLPQRRVAAAMTAELEGGPRAGHDPARFFFHVGDIAYPHGEEASYRSQFFAAYRDYTGPILAVPGNHDAEGDDGLDPFLRAFCSATPPLLDAGAASSATSRPVAFQPHVHWTLVHDWVRIIGLYTNVPEGGQLADDQLRWLVGELAASPRDTVTILAMHQPVYSADVVHGSNLELGEVIDACAAEAGRGPDAVLCGHAHCYQRFDRRRAGRTIPYVVAGAGGFHELHSLGYGIGDLPARFHGLDGVVLGEFEDRAHGFLTVTARPGAAEAIYTAVTAHGAHPRDRFAITAPASR